MTNARLDRQMDFLVEADKLKSIDRSNVLMDRSRPENVGEHCWHVCLYAMTMAEFAPDGTDIARVIAMLLIHDLVEIDAGDMPVWQDHDAELLAKTEDKAAHRIFGLLPDDQAKTLYDLWVEFEENSTPDAIFAKRLDHLQPIIQVLDAPVMKAEHTPIARHTLTKGRASRLAHDWPDAYNYALARLDNIQPQDTEFARKTGFLAEADKLKTVDRATTLCDASRYENSAEHSWHLALYAFVLAEHSEVEIDTYRLLEMLILHDLVEIDAGDVPVFGAQVTGQQTADEMAAAQRIFGLLPADQAQQFLAIWQEFEANETPTAQFAKSLDRFQPPIQNLQSGGVSWNDFKVSYATFTQRVAEKIANGAPKLWEWLQPKAADWFATHRSD